MSQPRHSAPSVPYAHNARPLHCIRLTHPHHPTPTRPDPTRPHTGDQPFAICCNASGQALGLRDLHAGNDLVAYVDPKRPRPPQATEAGAETLPIPRGPKPAPFSHNFQDVFRPAVGSAHMRVGLVGLGGRVCARGGVIRRE